MLVSLKKLHNSILQERYAKYATPQEENADVESARKVRDAPKLTKQTLNKIYELEYKLFRLALYKREHGNWLHDTANVKYLQWKAELEKTLSDSIKHLYNTFVAWATLEEHLFIIDETYPDGRAGWETNINWEMSSKHSDVPVWSDEYDELRGEMEIEKKNEYLEEVWNEHRPYPAVQKAIDALKNPRGTVQDRIVMFHKGLTTAHNSGEMLEYAISGGAYYSNKEYLDNLSRGIDIPKWNDELQKIGLIQQEGLQLTEAIEKHPTPEQLAKTLF